MQKVVIQITENGTIKSWIILLIFTAGNPTDQVHFILSQTLLKNNLGKIFHFTRTYVL
ncbi:hypothetical protein CLOSTMETH_03423 [[Clostridium] methylpentosum DSM 5476]|uniref:Uncharacterized protein n=1 Tax=[Clostridium] methylpentosum DSM 5476 TaxID=537013 RepID=C0EHS8_9FIRM|nr:hypothetical protein CLOSTMETH_03423 [[Clostridium] methylpentosum DSM 5476]